MGQGSGVITTVSNPVPQRSRRRTTELYGKAETGPAPTMYSVVFDTGPAAGKTCLIAQMVLCAVTGATGGDGDGDGGEGGGLVPLMVRVQDLQKTLLARDEATSKQKACVKKLKAAIKQAAEPPPPEAQQQQAAAAAGGGAATEPIIDVD